MGNLDKVKREVQSDGKVPNFHLQGRDASGVVGSSQGMGLENLSQTCHPLVQEVLDKSQDVRRDFLGLSYITSLVDGKLCISKEFEGLVSENVIRQLEKLDVHFGYELIGVRVIAENGKQVIDAKISKNIAFSSGEEEEEEEEG